MSNYLIASFIFFLFFVCYRMRVENIFQHIFGICKKHRKLIFGVEILLVVVFVRLSLLMNVKLFSFVSKCFISLADDDDADDANGS